VAIKHDDDDQVDVMVRMMRQDVEDMEVPVNFAPLDISVPLQTSFLADAWKGL
jgi:hypothetical protein